jgi:hypothetical protein
MLILLWIGLERIFQQPQLLTPPVEERHVALSFFSQHHNLQTSTRWDAALLQHALASISLAMGWVASLPIYHPRSRGQSWARRKAWNPSHLTWGDSFPRDRRKFSACFSNGAALLGCLPVFGKRCDGVDLRPQMVVKWLLERGHNL